MVQFGSIPLYYQPVQHTTITGVVSFISELTSLLSQLNGSLMTCPFVFQSFSCLQQLAGQASSWILFQLSHEKAFEKVRIGKICNYKVDMYFTHTFRYNYICNIRLCRQLCWVLFIKISTVLKVLLWNILYLQFLFYYTYNIEPNGLWPFWYCKAIDTAIWNYSDCHDSLKNNSSL